MNRYLEKMRVKYRDFYGSRSIIGFMMAMGASIESGACSAGRWKGELHLHNLREIYDLIGRFYVLVGLCASCAAAGLCPNVDFG